jgi:hypothetical protein
MNKKFRAALHDKRKHIYYIAYSMYRLVDSGGDLLVSRCVYAPSINESILFAADASENYGRADENDVCPFEQNP